ncbi:uncharacterized protein Z518_02346 [Rhinocladiella mackenziei CBS 650.93]|uniref:Rhinocladiella mackenziei CBS 650.93 unplaced genomic scaffold supercont1.2, whole genome shotgun sequence n=1 Tax=Rhinocladiella mackenziei CBS 650.93 TaxID=1442369 RepID=A0A0D2FZH1_9EURO|nr:uncharacterized protein Z518_02346 [Rhinocladiella mackenziei CBS 650.93]KIX07692.1 hypothetical protein Z518_02346 [Rhinocladiella mackenziei CBS 650.93]
MLVLIGVSDISTRQYYSSDLEFFRRNDRGIPIPLSQSSHIPDQYETSSHLSSRTTPSETENRATSGSRKRVPVACERCRKRKIKCSGNEGDNQSCANCKHAGHEDTCRFLRVSSMETGPFGFRSWQGPPRYSPYSLPSNHRLNYISLSSRCNPQASLQYPSASPNLDFGEYANPNPNIDWARTPYVGSYSPYPDDEVTRPYSAQPPPYILPNTDPMSVGNGYYVHTQGVRPHLEMLWADPQHCMPQPTSQLPNSTFTVTSEAPQSFHTIGLSGNLPSDRILPTPITGRSFIPPPIISMDSIPLSTSNHRYHTYWTSETATSDQQVSAPVDPSASPDQSKETRDTSYTLQDMPYGQMSSGESLSTTAVSSGLPLTINETQPSPNRTITSPEEVQPQAQQTGPGLRLRTVSQESLKSTPESTPMTYGYKGSVSGRISRLRNATGRLSSGSLYGRTQMAPRRNPTSDDYSHECSSYQTDSNRASVAPISNVSSGY